MRETQNLSFFTELSSTADPILLLLHSIHYSTWFYSILHKQPLPSLTQSFISYVCLNPVFFNFSN